MKIKSFLSATGAFFVDISVIIAATIVIDKVLSHWLFIYSGILFLIVLFFYYLLMHVFCKGSIGKHFFGISLQSKQGESLAFKKILLREVYKTVIGIGIPVLTVYLYCRVTANFYGIFPWVTGIWLIINLIYFIIKKESCWDTLAGTKKVKLPVSKQNRLKAYLLLLLIWGGSYLFFMLHNNLNNPSERKYMGFKFPLKLTEYPDNRRVKPYKEFLNRPLQNPEDYILDLFQHYDIVILYEHSHQENSEWDLIYDVVSDPRFIHNVGNIFTEYGAVWAQPKVDTFLSTYYPDDISLSKATAAIMNYHSGNFYNFMKRLNVLNSTLPDSLKIQEHFTDIGHFLYLVNCYKDSLYSDDPTVNPRIEHRDSLMAQVVIDWYNACHQKCLVVTNYRHAFAMDREAMERNYSIWKRYFSWNEAQYIYDQFPASTARVLYFAPVMNNVFFIDQPIHHGKWKRAFKENHYKPVGFDFKNSPFGKDSFDSYYMSILLKNIQYQDMFTGMVFYKPQEEYTYTEPWYERYGAEQEYIEASKNNLIDTTWGKQVVKRYFDNPESQKELFGLNNADANWLYTSVYYYFDLFLFILTVGIALLLSTISTFCSLIKKNYKT